MALFNPDHTHHEVAHDWFADNHSDGWATCALTQNGFVRVLSERRGSRRYVSASQKSSISCGVFAAAKEHVFWPDAVSLTDATLFNPSLIRGHRQVSDVYLLGLAKKMGGYLATFDAGIPLSAVVGATRNTIAVISPGGPATNPFGGEPVRPTNGQHGSSGSWVAEASSGIPHESDAAHEPHATLERARRLIMSTPC